MFKVSICIPTCNSAHFLPQAIESVLAQDYADYELVICDNASTDSTPELCRGYADSRVRYLRREDQTNQAGNFNRCLDAAQGEYLTILHADDYFLPGFLRDRAERLDRQPEIALVCGAVQVIDAAGQPLSVSTRWDKDQVVPSREFQQVLLHGCVVCPPSLMARRTCVARAGRFREDWTWGHDWEWSFRLAGQGPVNYAAMPLAAYRVHDGSGTAEILSAAKNGGQEQKILCEMLGAFAGEPRQLRALRKSAFWALSCRHMYFAEQALLHKRRRVAYHNLHYAARAHAAMLIRPMFWALFLGCMAPTGLYKRLRSIRQRFRGVEGAV